MIVERSIDLESRCLDLTSNLTKFSFDPKKKSKVEQSFGLNASFLSQFNY